MIFSNNPVITDYDIQALVDNALPEDEAKRVMDFTRKNPAAMKRYRELVKQKNLIRKWWEEL